MNKLQTIWIVGLLVCAVSAAWAQDSSTPPSAADAAQAPPKDAQQPVAAYGLDNAAVPISENPPLSGLDLPSLEPSAAPVSYIQPGVTFSESAESNAGSALGGGGVSSLSRALGSLMLKRLWSH